MLNNYVVFRNFRLVLLFLGWVWNWLLGWISAQLNFNFCGLLEYGDKV